MAKRKKGLKEITGLVNLYKPPNITSFKAADTFRKRIEAKKAGHCGTLDPMADGVLLVCFGQAVRFVDIIGRLEKKYEGIMKLGESTDTQDKEGNIINRSNYEHLTSKKIEKAFQQFEGVIEQCPPMYSAVKHKGKPLYLYARNGIEIDRASREVFIKSLTIDKIFLPYVHFRVTCSKGTFIRTLCDDIGQLLGCYGHLNKLTRTAIGDFRIQDSVLIDDLPEIHDDINESNFLMPIQKALYFLDTLVVDDARKYKMLNGQQVQASLNDSFKAIKSKNGMMKIMDTNMNFICVASVLNNHKLDYFTLQPKIVIHSNNMVKSN